MHRACRFSASPKLHGNPCQPPLPVGCSLCAPAAPTSMLHCLQLHTTPAKSREYGGFREGIFYAFEKVVKQHGAALAYPTHVSDCHKLKLVISSQGHCRRVTTQLLCL